MSVLLLALIGFAGLYVGWNIGANDAANCMGTSVGAGLLRYRTAIAIVAVFVVIGGVIDGHAVMKTIGTGIVTSPLSPRGVLTALICSGFFVTLATFFKMPTSTSQAIVGGVTGVGLAANLSVNGSKLATIVQCWVFSPVLTLAMAYVLFRIVRRLIDWIPDQNLAYRVISVLMVASVAYVAYSLGANNVGSAIGPIASLEVLGPRWLTLLGGASLAVGALTFGHGVTETVGRSITPLDVPGAFAAQVSAAFGIHLFSLLGIPVSTSQAIVGAVLGVGLVYGARTVSRRKLLEIAVGWVLTPTLAGTVSFVVYKLISLVA
jgi:PiT family inorganic phosphate transporter